MKSKQRFFSRYGNWLALLLLLIFFGRLLATAQAKSATYDEILHVFQAALYWHNNTLYSVVQNPPLIHSLMGIPLSLAFKPLFPAGIEPISNWLAMSKSFMWEYNDTGLQMLAVARLAIIWLATLLGAVVYRWSGQLFSAKIAGLLALVLYSFDPNILAHSYLATTDLGTAFFYALAGYLVWRYWQDNSVGTYWHYAAAGIAIGLALAAKFSGLILFPAVVTIAIYRLISRDARKADWWRAFLEIFGWVAIGIIVFLAVYRFSLEPLSLDFTWQRDHQLRGRTGFLLGQFARSWWYYFPLVLAIKTPISTILLFFVGVILFLWRRRWDWQIVWPLLLAGGVFAASLISRVNIGYRYLLPMLPPLAIFLGQLAQPAYLRNRVLRVSVSTAIVVTMVISILTHPHYLAYFNVLAGGPDNAWNIVVDSNIDWGQDLQGLASYMDEAGIDFVNANWLGTAPLETYGINGRTVLGWPTAKENPLYDWFYPARPAPGFYAFSVTQLQGLYLKDKARFTWFRERQPTDKIGYSLFVYDVPADGEKVGLAISGIGLGTIEKEDFDQAFKSNDVQPRWYDARSSLVWPGGNPDGDPVAVWTVIGNGHLPENPALRALYPEDGPWRRSIGAGGFQYVLYQWEESPIIDLQTSGDNEVIRTQVGWTPEPVLGSDFWDEERLPLQGPAVLGSVLEFKGYQPLWTSPLQSGERAEILSFWEVVNSPQQDIKLFVHFVNGSGEIIAQHDGLDILMEGLQVGDELVQLHVIELPEDLESGEYGLQIGAYQTADSARLKLSNGSSDRLLLDKFSVIKSDEGN